MYKKIRPFVDNRRRCKKFGLYRYGGGGGSSGELFLNVRGDWGSPGPPLEEYTTKGHTV